MTAKHNPKGLVFNIQRFTVHDGPGIRTEVFLKGCPLKCRWCSNPEGIKPFGEVGLYSDRCLGVDKCGLCLQACPKADEGALIVNENRVKGIERSLCTGCQACAEVCPSPNTMKTWGKEMSVLDVLKVIEADRDFYDRSGGGVTLSGGEALIQPDFTEELFKTCCDHKIHTCLESTLFCRPNLLDRILRYVDFLITDIKHMDPQIHQKYTGVGNDQILKNMIKAAQFSIPMVVRVPVVAGVNNDENNIHQTAEFISKNLAGSVVQVQLLPFKELGVEKYRALGLDYQMADYDNPVRAEWESNILRLTEVMRSSGVPAVAGSSTKIQ